MGIVVQKFGGSSVATVERLKEVARQIVERRRAGAQVVVVVSAMGKTTDALIAQAREVTANPPRRELDMLVTAGERISMALLSMAIAELGFDSISFTGSQSGIITDDSHQGARILEVRPHRIIDELERGRIVTVAGFQGVSRTTKEITTLGRGGSDTTAVALAAALAAESCEIYSDVDGVYSADPNVVPQARLLTELGYEVMQDMATMGAKVLNADAVEFARRAGIVIHARKTGDASGRETTVHAKAKSASGVAAVVGAERVSLVRVDALASVPAAIEACAAVGGRCMGIAGAEAPSLLVDRTGIPGAAHELLVQAIADVGVIAEVDRVVLASLVGVGLLTRPRVFVDALAVCEGVHAHPVAAVAHDGAIALALSQASSSAAVQALHAHFIDQAGVVATA